MSQVHAVAVSIAVTLRRLDLGALLDQLAQFFWRERPVLSPLGLLPRDVHLDILIGLATAIALLALFAFAGGLRLRAFHPFDQIIAHPFRVCVGKRITFAALASFFDQLLEPIVECADLLNAGHDVGVARANRSKVFASHADERRIESLAHPNQIERRAH